MTTPQQSLLVIARRELALFSFILAIIVPAANGAQLNESRITQFVKDVKLLPNAAVARPAVLSDEVRDGTAVNILNGLVVNVGGQNPANVFTSNPNYSGFGGNGTRTGTFSGAGANNPLPLNQAPPLDPGG